MIVTFYSFKGGVGRSMALANVANWLRMQGLKTAVVDWDLEAPGLENFFYTSEPNREMVRKSPGVIDLIMAYKEQHARLPVAFFAPEDPGATPIGGSKPTTEQITGAADMESLNRRADILATVLPPPERLVLMLHPENQREPRNDQPLYFLPAGVRDLENEEDYARDIQSLSWNEFYDTYDGSAFFHWFRRAMQTSFDIVLIDSRTGFTEVGGVCTRELADIVISLAAPNAQNVDGCIRMTRSFYRSALIEARGGRPIHAAIVPARYENAENDLLLAFGSTFGAKVRNLRDLDPDPGWRGLDPTLMWDLRIPYIPKYAYGEGLCVGAVGANSDLERQYSSLGKFVTEIYFASVSEEKAAALSLRSPLLAELARARVSESHPDPKEAAFRALSPETQEIAPTIFLRLVGLADPNDRHSLTTLRKPLTEFPTLKLRAGVHELTRHGLLTSVSNEAPELESLASSEPDTSRVWVTLDPALLTTWPRLRKWIEDDREFLVRRQRVRGLAAQAQSTHLAPGSADLAFAKELLDKRGDDLAPSEHEFIQASIAAKRRAIVLRTILTMVVVAVGATFAFGAWRESQRRAQVEERTARARAIVVEARSLVDAGNLSLAGDKLTEALALDPGSAEALILRGQIRLSSNAPRAAVQDLNAAIAQDSTAATAIRLRGQAYFALGRADSALRDYEASSRRFDQDPVTFFELGRLQQTNGGDSAAVESYSRAIRLKPDYWEAYYNRAIAALRLGNERQAAEDLDSLLAGVSDPNLRISAIAKRAEIKTPIRDAKDNRPRGRPQTDRVYFHYVNPSDARTIAALADRLEERKTVIVERPQLVSQQTDGEVRYFFPSDRSSAEEVRNLVQGAISSEYGIRRVQLKLLELDPRDFSGAKRGTIQVCLPSLARASNSQGSGAP